MRRLKRARCLLVVCLLVAFAAGCGDSATGLPEEPLPPLSRSAASGPRSLAPEGRDRLVSMGRRTPVHAQPSHSSAKLGYLRAGTMVNCAPRPSGREACDGGWYRIEPRGHVCVDERQASFDVEHAVVKLAGGGSAELRRRAQQGDGLPYVYATSRYPPPPFYGHLPSAAEQRQREPDLKEHLREHDELRKRRTFVPPPPADAQPPLILGGGVLPGLDGVQRGAQWNLGRARRRSGFALLASYQHEGRGFGLTSDLVLIPLDRTRIVPVPGFRGMKLDGAVTLPVAFVTSARAHRYRRRGGERVRRLSDVLSRRAALNLTGEELRTGKHTYLQLSDGDYVRADHVVRVDRFRKAPAWARRGDKWIDISLAKQTLLAYDGKRPVFTTLISTGRDGLAKHDDSRATIQGTFLIHTKYLSHTMDGDGADDAFRLADVPFVQYFTKGYALHGAYWHDDFGEPRSHGCINLSPPDAYWLFEWTSPEVPSSWHAALAPDDGTLVHIHP